MVRRYVLIGAGPGSLAAAESIRAADSSAQVTIVGADPHGYYSRPGLAYYLAKEVPEKGLFPFSAHDIADLNVEMIADRAERIDRTAHQVALASGRVLSYDKVLVATGSSAIPVRTPGANLEGVVKLDDMDDARDLIARSRRAKTAVVVGGGITALEIVEGLRAHKVHVHYFMRKDRYWSNVLSPTESQIVEQGLKSRGVTIHYFTELAGILGKNGHVAGVETGDGTQIPCDLVAVAIGVMPHCELARAAGLECGRGMLVDQCLRSADPDIFAAGDVAEVCEDLTDRRTLEVLWSSAVTKGRIAGLNMVTDGEHKYSRPAPLNVTRLAGFKVTIIGTVGTGEDSDLEGISRGDSETWREIGDAATVEAAVDHANVRLALGGSSIAGAVIMGDQALSFPLQELIEARADITAIRGQLVMPGAPIAQIINDFWSQGAADHV